MSIRVMNDVWSKSAQKGSALLLLLAIADNANDSGEAWPGIEYLAHKTRLSERQVQRLIKELEQTGELALISRGAGRSETHFYIVLIGYNAQEIRLIQTHCRLVSDAYKKGDKMSPFLKDIKGDKMSPISKKGDKKGDIAMSPEPLTIESEDEEEESPPSASAFVQRILELFVQATGPRPGYQPTPKEIQAAESLEAGDFSLEEIRAGIEHAVAHSNSPIKHFTYCARVIRQRRELALETVPHPPESPEGGHPATEPAVTRPADLVIDADLTTATDLLRSAGIDITPSVLLRLRRMADHCEAAAQAASASGGGWLADSLHLGIGVAQPEKLMNYAQTVLESWIVHGRPKPPKPRQKQKSEPGKPNSTTMEQALTQFFEERQVQTGGNHGN